MQKAFLILVILLSATTIAATELEDNIYYNLRKYLVDYASGFKNGETEHASSEYSDYMEIIKLMDENIHRYYFSSNEDDTLYVQLQINTLIIKGNIGFSITTWTESGQYHGGDITASSDPIWNAYSPSIIKKFLQEQEYLTGDNRSFMPVPKEIYLDITRRKPNACDLYYKLFNIQYVIRNGEIKSRKIYKINYPVPQHSEYGQSETRQDSILSNQQHHTWWSNILNLR